MIVTEETLTDRRLRLLESRQEGHFLDYKSKRTKASSLPKHISAFANADGGEIIIGHEDPKRNGKWDGFDDPESANGLIAHLNDCFGHLGILKLLFLRHPNRKGVALLIEIEKSAQIVKLLTGEIYQRKGAQSLHLDTPEKIRRVEIDKGIFKYENSKLQSDESELANTLAIIEFMLDAIPSSEPLPWLRKQKLCADGKTTIAGQVLFSDEPQIELPKTSIKVYRYKTKEKEGSRDTLDFDPLSVDGCAYNQIYAAVKKVKDITEGIPIVGASGLEKISYPEVAVHEVITNAVIHRDYSIDDDVHVRIFDDRVEVESPGKLPAHITAQNILNERFARNPKIVRILNKFKNPPNKDVGEGLNTTFQAMRDVKLHDPIIEQRENSVLVILKHESLASAEEIIVNYLKEHDEINNTKAREICFIGDANKMKRVFQKMQESDLISRIPGRAQNKTAYVKGKNFPSD